MSTADSYVRARIDSKTKQRASDALGAMGLSVSDAIRLLMVRIATEQKLPFDIKIPNPVTLAAIDELNDDKSIAFNSATELLADLNADD